MTWAILTAGAVGFVVVFGTNAPYADEWEFVPVLLGEEPAGPWLWAQHNEHRLPLHRAVFYPLFRLTHDFRAGSLVQVALLSALSLWLMSLAARLRGRPELADVFFPVSLLHLGHWENFIMGYQLCFALFTALATALVVVALRTTRGTAYSSGVSAGGLLLLLALTGGSGLVVVVPVAAWLAYLAWVVWRDGGGRGKAAALLALAAMSLAYIPLYFTDYERPAHHPPTSRDPVAVAMVAGEVLAVSLGIGVSGAWKLVCAAELVLGVATVVVLFRRPGHDRTAAFGLVAVVAGVTGVAVAIGVGRAPFGTDMGLWSRYSLLAWPLLGAAYLAWAKAGPKWPCVGLCVASALAFTGNTGTGMLYANSVREHYAQVEADARLGLPAEAIVNRNFPESCNSGQMERADRGIPLLRAANVGIFASDDSGAADGLWWLLGGIGGVVFLGFVVRWTWHLCKAVMAERARELFRLQHERFEEQLLVAAGATGLPRGLRWVSCTITGDAVLVRDSANGGIVALVPVSIRFEPEPDSDMVENPAAREPRPATAVFTFRCGVWETAGRVVFNHTPDQTVAAFAPQFRVIHHGHH